MIGIEIKDIQTTNFVVYRPPNTKREELKVILETLRNLWKKIGSHTCVSKVGRFGSCATGMGKGK